MSEHMNASLFAEQNEGNENLNEKARIMHLICASGGVRAIFGCAGAIFGLEGQGYKEWHTIGGVSGGAIPAIATASGVNARDLLRQLLYSDISAMMKRSRRVLSVVWSYLHQDKTNYMPATALMDSEHLGKFIESIVPTWPKGFWTMAVAYIPERGFCQVLFTDHGVFRYFRDGSKEQLSDKPAPVGLALRATCAVPGVIGHVDYMGMSLYDGMLSWDGHCPIGVLNRHFGAEAGDIVACDVSPEKAGFSLSNTFLDYWTHPDGQARKVKALMDDWEAKGVSIVKAPITEFGTLHMRLPADKRRLAFKKAVRAVSVKFKRKNRHKKHAR